MLYWLSDFLELTTLESIVYWTLFTITALWVDIEHYVDQDWIEKHLSRWTMRFILWLAISIDTFSLVVNGMLWILLFSPGWGAVVHGNLFYLGTVAKYDKFFNKYPWLYKLILGLLLIALIYLCYEKITTGTSVVG